MRQEGVALARKPKPSGVRRRPAQPSIECRDAQLEEIAKYREKLENMNKLWRVARPCAEDQKKVSDEVLPELSYFYRSDTLLEAIERAYRDQGKDLIAALNKTRSGGASEALDRSSVADAFFFEDGVARPNVPLLEESIQWAFSHAEIAKSVQVIRSVRIAEGCGGVLRNACGGAVLPWYAFRPSEESHEVHARAYETWGADILRRVETVEASDAFLLERVMTKKQSWNVASKHLQRCASEGNVLAILLLSEMTPDVCIKRSLVQKALDLLKLATSTEGLIGESVSGLRNDCAVILSGGAANMLKKLGVLVRDRTLRDLYRDMLVSSREDRTLRSFLVALAHLNGCRSRANCAHLWFDITCGENAVTAYADWEVCSARIPLGHLLDRVLSDIAESVCGTFGEGLTRGHRLVHAAYSRRILEEEEDAQLLSGSIIYVTIS